MRFLCVTGLILTALVLAVPAGAKRPAEPTKLWSEYPLEPNVEQAAPAQADVFLPPANVEPPVASESSPWSLWIPLALGAIALLLVARGVRPFAAAGGHIVDRGARALTGRARGLRGSLSTIRPTGGRPGRPRPRPAVRPHRTEPGGQYAPLSVVAEPEPEPEQAVPYVSRRSGLVRSRYVVLVEEESGRVHELRRSRAFWQVGREARQRRLAEDAWDGLANDLRADGWEVDAAGRYEYFVPLRRAIVSTLEPYTRRDRSEPPDHA